MAADSSVVRQSVRRGELERLVASPQQGPGLSIEAFRVSLEDLRSGYGQGAVHVDRELRDQPLPEELVEDVEHLLGTSHSEARDHHLALLLDRISYDGEELLQGLLLGLVEAISVRGFQQEHLSVLYGLRILDDGLIPPSQIPRKEEFPAVASIVRPQLHGGGPEDVAGILKADVNPSGHLLPLSIRDLAKEPEGLAGVLLVVERGDRPSSHSEVPSGLPRGLHLLYMGAVQEHDLAQVPGGGCAVNGPRITRFDQGRDEPGVIHVGMGEHHRFQLHRPVDLYPAIAFLQRLRSLEQATVHKDRTARGLHPVRCPRHSSRPSDKGDPHRRLHALGRKRLAKRSQSRSSGYWSAPPNSNLCLRCL